VIILIIDLFFTGSHQRWVLEYQRFSQHKIEILSLSEQGALFQLAILGKQFASYPEISEEARKKLKKHIVHGRYVKNSQECVIWLYKVDLLPVTSVHDFLGIKCGGSFLL